MTDTPGRWDPTSRRGVLEGSWSEVLPVVPSGRMMAAPVALVPRDPEGRPWDLMRGEDIRWYQRFEIYRAIGSGRSMSESYKRWQRQESQRLETPLPLQAQKKRAAGAPTNWWKIASLWRWKERAEAWDAHQVEEMRRAELRTVVDARSAQVVAGKAARSTALKAIQIYNANPALVKPGEAAILLKIGDEMISKGLGLDDRPVGEGRDPIHVKVIDFGDEEPDQPALPPPADASA